MIFLYDIIIVVVVGVFVVVAKVQSDKYLQKFHCSNFIVIYFYDDKLFSAVARAIIFQVGKRRNVRCILLGATGRVFKWEILFLIYLNRPGVVYFLENIFFMLQRQ